MKLLIALLLCAVSRASAAELDDAINGVKKRYAANIERIAALPVEFAAVATIVPYGEEPIPALGANPSRADVLGLLAAKEQYWRKVSGLIEQERKRRHEARARAEQALKDAQDAGDYSRIVELAVAQSRAHAACLEMVEQDDAVRYILGDIDEDRKLLNGVVKPAERLVGKQNLLRAIGTRLKA